MKYNISKKIDKIKLSEMKNLAELLVFAFSMFALTTLIIFASIEANSEKIIDKEKAEAVSLIYDSAIYEFLDLDLLEKDEIVGGVSKKEENVKKQIDREKE